MNKSELIEKVHEEVREQNRRIEVPRVVIERALGSFVRNIEKAVASGDSVTIVGFGTFSSKWQEEREGINPQTLEKVTIPAKYAVKFKPGNEFKNIVNEERK